MPAGIYQQEEQGINVPLSLPPYGAWLVVFKEHTPTFHYERITTSGTHPPRIQYIEDGFYFLEEGTVALISGNQSKTLENHLQTQSIEGAWQVTFPKNWGAPDSANFPALISWTEANDKGIQYFSGTATYHKTFQFNRNDTKDYGRITLDLGKLSEVGAVWLNGQPLGITWSEPHAFDVTNLLQEGENTLTIEVANTWSNRLTGDAQMGESYTNTNISTAFRGTTWEQAPLLESGLLGPVTLYFTNIIMEK